MCYIVSMTFAFCQYWSFSGCSGASDFLVQAGEICYWIAQCHVVIIDVTKMPSLGGQAFLTDIKHQYQYLIPECLHSHP